MKVAFETRPATSHDVPAILRLLGASMSRADDARFELLFRWKHFENAFGPSPMWVACDGGRVVAFRTFMRWEFVRGAEVVHCVRAVDTATHPDYQGRGLFTQLTMAALADLGSDGVRFVFNTPNAQSRPGYLKMGWKTIGRARACVLPLSPSGAVTLLRNRVPASHWSEPATIGSSAAELLDGVDDALLEELLSAPGTGTRLHTRASRSFLRWRYASAALPYRAIVAPGGPERGVALMRLRRRGHAREVVVAALLGSDTTRARRALLREVRRSIDGHADYMIGIGSLPGFAPVPALGPIVTTRALSEQAPDSIAGFRLTMGDIELF
jgi:GNAT superfamily N-acetyltransferase